MVFSLNLRRPSPTAPDKIVDTKTISRSPSLFIDFWSSDSYCRNNSPVISVIEIVASLSAILFSSGISRVDWSVICSVDSGVLISWIICPTTFLNPSWASAFCFMFSTSRRSFSFLSVISSEIPNTPIISPNLLFNGIFWLRTIIFFPSMMEFSSVTFTAFVFITSRSFILNSSAQPSGHGSSKSVLPTTPTLELNPKLFAWVRLQPKYFPCRSFQ